MNIKVILVSLVLLVAGCDSGSSVTTEVSKTQNYEMPKEGIVEWYIVPEKGSPCQELQNDPYGCTFRLSEDKFVMWIHEDRGAFKVTKPTLLGVIDHEFDHVIYGPEHTQ